MQAYGFARRCLGRAEFPLLQEALRQAPVARGGHGFQGDGIAQHLDGLLDLGDGLMAHGGREKRIAALTDLAVGAGGVGLGLVVTLVAFAGLSSVPSVPAAILAGEVLARLGTAWITVAGRPFREGIHATLHRGARPVHGILALVLAVPLLLVLPAVPLILAGAVTALVTAGMIALGDRLFGGVNGDLAGAAHEITRALVIASLAMAL